MEDKLDSKELYICLEEVQEDIRRIEEKKREKEASESDIFAQSLLYEERQFIKKLIKNLLKTY